MRNFKYYRLLNILLIVVMFCSCLTPKKALKKGHRAFDQGQYYRASSYFKKARSLPTKGEKSEVNFYLGECYNHLLRFSYAEGAYNLSVKYSDNNPEAWLRLAQMQQINEKYDLAIESYQKYLIEYPGDLVAINGIEACRSIQDLKAPSEYHVTEFKIFNSQKSTYCPAFQGNKTSVIYLTSNRNQAQGNLVSRITGTKTSDIFYSKLNAQGEWVKPSLVEGEVNTQADEGSVSFNEDGTEMYFSRSEHQGSDSLVTTIMHSERTGAKWSNPSILSIAPDSVLVAHPAISPDGKTLYFVSDMKGGLGGKDIWFVQKENGKWGLPQNAGAEINSSGDEMFPYVRAEGELYFSSNGREGIGGLDIYCAKKNINDNWTISHLPTPINSHKDDFGICFEGKSNKGFFSSNRNNNRGYDRIFSFEIPTYELKITGIVKDSQTKEPVGLARVHLVGNDGLSESLSVRKNGSFQQKLNPNSKYIFMVSAPDYLNQRVEFKTADLKEDHEYEYLISLVGISHPVTLNNVFYDFGSAELKSEAKISLDSLAKTLEDNPKLTIEISSHTDGIGTDSANMVLSQRRAQGVVDYLIEQGIDKERLTAVGYGENQPVVVDAGLLEKYSFLRAGDILDEELMRILTKKQRNIVNQINRRTEFKVLQTNYQKNVTRK